MTATRGKDSRGRSSEQEAALERDEYKCQWHLVVMSVLRQGNHAHHLFRPRQKYDYRQYIVTLCPECHSGLRHTKGTLTDRMLIEQVMIPYIWDGQDLTPTLLPDSALRGRGGAGVTSKGNYEPDETRRIFDL